MLALVLAMFLAQGPRDLTGQLGSDDFAVRDAATRALEEMGPIALPALEDAARSADPEVRTRAEEIIRAVREVRRYGARIDPERQRRLTKALHPDVIVLGEDTGSYEPVAEDLPYLLAELDSPRSGEKAPLIRSPLSALDEIGKLPIDEADERRLHAILQTVFPSLSDPPLREELYEFQAWIGRIERLRLCTLWKSFTATATQGYEALARSPDSGQRKAAIDGLTGWMGKGAKAELIRLLSDGDESVSVKALQALGRYDVSDVRAPLREFMRRTDDQGHSLLAAELLARSGDFSAFAMLFVTLWEDEACYRVAAATGLMRLLGREPIGDETAQADIEALKSWWAENGEIVHWDPLLKAFVAR